MLDKTLTEIEATVEEMIRLEEVKNKYVENLLVEIEVLHKRNEELNALLREFYMSMYMSEK